MTPDEAVKEIKKIAKDPDFTEENYKKYIKIMTSSLENMMEIIASSDQYARESDEFLLLTEFHIRAWKDPSNKTYRKFYNDIVKNYTEAYLLRSEKYQGTNLGRK